MSKNIGSNGKGEVVVRGAARVASEDAGLKSTRIALVEAGQLGEAILAGPLGAGILRQDQIVVTAAHQSRTDYIAERFKIRASLGNRDAVKAQTSSF